MFVVLRNVLSNGARARRNRSAATLRLAQMLRAKSGRDTVHQSDLAMDVARALESLSHDQAELVRLVHWDGFTIAEAGKIMGVGASTARGRYASARAGLRAALGAAVLTDATATAESAH